jgi:hypothetical protein
MPEAVEKQAEEHGMKKKIEVIWSDGRVTVHEYEDTPRAGRTMSAKEAFDLLRAENACCYTPRAAKPVSFREL